MTKALESGADSVILDLEDSVPIASKAEARSLIVGIIDQAPKLALRPAIFVRVNGASTGFLAEDLDAVVRPGLDAILLAKAENIEDVTGTSAIIDKLERERGMTPGSVEIILQIESAVGVYNCFPLIKSSKRVAATCFGSARDGDLQSDLGCSWSIEGTELLYARSKVLLDTRAAGSDIHPIDGVFSDLNDEAGLLSDSQLSARLGFIGRTVIHPKQIATVRNAYAVPEDAVAYYQKVVTEFAVAEKLGTAAIVVDGKLVDYAMAQRARRVLNLAQLDRS
jgi:citrate lyase subunit beta/citryl-CoA lyase